MQGICKHLGCQCVRFPCCLSVNTRSREKSLDSENYERFLQLSHGRSRNQARIRLQQEIDPLRSAVKRK